MKKYSKIPFLVTLLAIPVFSTLPTNDSVVSASEISDISLEESGSFFDNLTPANVQNIKSELKENGVTEEVSQSLIDKLNNGVAFDSMLYGEEDAVTVDTIPTMTGYKTTYTFTDGSITTSSTEELESVLNNTMSTFATGIKGGSTSSGTGYFNGSNREVYYTNPGVWSISFKANYSLTQGSYDKITWVGKHNITMIIAGTMNDVSLRIIRGTETFNQKAEARLSTYLTLGGGYGTMTRSVSLIVGGDAASARGNTYY